LLFPLQSDLNVAKGGYERRRRRRRRGRRWRVIQKERFNMGTGDRIGRSERERERKGESQ